MKKLLFIFLLGLGTWNLGLGTSFANSTKVDSLLQALQTAQHDTTRINTLNALALELRHNKPDTSIYYSKQALTLAEKAEWEKGIAKSHHNLGAFNYLKGNYPLALDYYHKSIKFLESIGYKRGEAYIYLNIGNIYNSLGNYPKALEYDYKSLEILEELGDSSGIAGCYNNIGGVYHNMLDYPKTLEYYHKFLNISEELGNKPRMAAACNNIGNSYNFQDNNPKALEYYHKCLKISEEIDDKYLMSTAYYNIGNIYRNQDDNFKALEYFHKDLKISEEIGQKREIARSCKSIGLIYHDQGNYPKALEYLHKALNNAKMISYKEQISDIFIDIGMVHTKLDQIDKAIEYLHKALAVSKEVGALQSVKYSYKSFTEFYEQQKNYKKAYEYHKLYSQTKDSLFNEEKSKEIGKLEAVFEYDKMLALEQAEHEKEAAVAASESVRQKVVIYAVSGGMLLLIVFFILLFNRFRIIRKQKNIIEEQKQVVDEKNVEITQKNKDITDSIRYAQNIQKAILPPIEEIKKGLPDSFVLFKPKDIVSGDFYFYARVNQYIIIAACDCTGHGVPGAFMSMIGNSLLNEIVNDRSVTDAAEVLNQLRDGVIHAFGEAGATGEQKDGMDMALISLEFQVSSSKLNTNDGIATLQYAGAYNPLYIVRSTNKSPLKGGSPPAGGQGGVDASGTKFPDTEYQPAGDSSPPQAGQNDPDTLRYGAGKYELTQIPADKQPVGYHFGKQMPFTNHEIQLQKGDTVYIFSDGYQDQFGGPRGKKFMSKRFRQLFIDIHTLNMEEQKEYLNKTIEDWKDGREQVDDILVIGVKV